MSAETQTAEPKAEGFLPELARRLGEGGANVETIFSAPVERDGTTVIAVAKARWGIGGGTGSRPAAREGTTEVGSGGGAGATVTPVGYIEIKNGASRFRPIRDPAQLLPLVIAGSLTTLSILRVIDRREMRRPTRYRTLARSVRRLRTRSKLRGIRKWLGI
jgi:uncharacterized spore protein YtfJ